MQRICGDIPFGQGGLRLETGQARSWGKVCRSAKESARLHCLSLGAHPSVSHLPSLWIEFQLEDPKSIFPTMVFTPSQAQLPTAQSQDPSQS